MHRGIIYGHGRASLWVQQDCQQINVLFYTVHSFFKKIIAFYFLISFSPLSHTDPFVKIRLKLSFFVAS